MDLYINSTIFILDASLEVTKIISGEVTAAPGSRVGTSTGAGVRMHLQVKTGDAVCQVSGSGRAERTFCTPQQGLEVLGAEDSACHR